MSGTEIDLTNPDHLAALLGATLPENEDTAGEVASLIEELERSDHPAFAHVGVAQPFSEEDLEVAHEDAHAGIGPEDDLEVGSPDQLRAGNRPWTDIDRRRARGQHVTYRLHAAHTRREPIESKFTGECQSVRVTLPKSKPDRDRYIGTFLGKVEVADHLLFSIDEVVEAYRLRWGTLPKIERVDLITGARHLGRRFSPVSIFLAYAKADQPEHPCFFMLEGGSASGQPKALYIGKDMDTRIHQQAGFRFTPLTCSTNWYTGGVEMRDDGNPKAVFLTSAQERDGSHEYIDLHVAYAVEKQQKRVISPFALQVEAAMRVLAIAEQAGCELGQGRGGGLQPVLGPVAEATMPWDIRPRGTTTAESRARYCGCPKTTDAAGGSSSSSSEPVRNSPTPTSDPTGDPSGAESSRPITIQPSKPPRSATTVTTRDATGQPPARASKKRPT